MTVERLRREMPHDEWIRWGVYFGRIAQRRELAAKTANSRWRW